MPFFAEGMRQHLATHLEGRHFNSRRSYPTLGIVFRAVMTPVRDDERPVPWDREQTLVSVYVDWQTGDFPLPFHQFHLDFGADTEATRSDQSTQGPPSGLVVPQYNTPGGRRTLFASWANKDLAYVLNTK